MAPVCSFRTTRNQQGLVLLHDLLFNILVKWDPCGKDQPGSSATGDVSRSPLTPWGHQPSITSPVALEEDLGTERTGRSPAITGAVSSPALLWRQAEPQQKPRLGGFAAGENSSSSGSCRSYFPFLCSPPTVCSFTFDFSASRKEWNECLLFKPSSLWCSVMVAWVE